MSSVRGTLDAPEHSSVLAFPLDYLWRLHYLMMSLRQSAIANGGNVVRQFELLGGFSTMILNSLRLHNFMSYADAVLDLTGIDVACLSGQNGAGKSALLDAITWCLW